MASAWENPNDDDTPGSGVLLAECMSPARFRPMEALPGVAALARDAGFRLLWCNTLYARLLGSTPSRILGTTMHDHLPQALANERETLMRPVLAEHKVVAYYQLWHGSRWFTRVWPLDRDAFGREGYFVIIQSIAQGEAIHHDPPGSAQLVTHADFAELAVLTGRELEVFYCLATGMPVADVARTLFRSERTIEQHARSIHRKLGIESRAQLVRFAVERGIVEFTRDEWLTMIEARENPG